MQFMQVLTNISKNVEESEILEHFFGEQLEVAENSDSASQEQTIVT